MDDVNVLVAGEFAKGVSRSLAFTLDRITREQLKAAREQQENAQRALKLSDLEKLMEQVEPARHALEEKMQQLLIAPPLLQELATKQYMELLEELQEIEQRGPTPAEIKKQLKHAKNPMQIKQLNRQLAKAYKEYGKGGRKDGKRRTGAKAEDGENTQQGGRGDHRDPAGHHDVHAPQ